MNQTHTESTTENRRLLPFVQERLAFVRARAASLPGEKVLAARAHIAGVKDRTQTLDIFTRLNAESVLLPYEAEQLARQEASAAIAGIRERLAEIEAELVPLEAERSTAREQGQAMLKTYTANASARVESVATWPWSEVSAPSKVMAAHRDYKALCDRGQALADERGKLATEMHATWRVVAGDDQCAIDNHGRAVRAEIEGAL